MKRQTRLIIALLAFSALIFLYRGFLSSHNTPDTTQQAQQYSLDSFNENTYNRINAPYDDLPRGDATEEGADNSNIIRAAFVAVVRNGDSENMRLTMSQIDDRFNKNYVYPYILLNDEEFSLNFKKNVLTATKAPVYFGKIDPSMWGYSPGVNVPKLKELIKLKKFDYYHGDSISYRMMSRFYANFIHKHPLLRNLDYFWRLRDDVQYYCDLDFDPFARMKKNGYKYGWVISPKEFYDTVASLWGATVPWILKNKDLLPEKSFAKWVMNEKNDYNLCHFWSNFEIVDLHFLRSKAYESYVTALDKALGYFNERWGDAPVRSIAASMLLSKQEIHWFEEIGYHHTGNKHCPKPEIMANKCTGCTASDSGVYDSECFNYYNTTLDISKAEFLNAIEKFAAKH